MDSILAWWVNDMDPFLFRFPENAWFEGIRWYGVSYLMGFFVAVGLLKLYYKRGKSPFNPDAQSYLITVLIIGVLLGGRLGYMLLYDFEYFVAHPLSFFAVQNGGMASHGGFIGVCLAVFWVAHKLKISWYRVGDIVVTLAPPGLCFGRIANFIGGYMWGKVTDVPWAVIFPQSALWEGMPVAMIEPRHPAPLYAAFLEGVVLFIFIQIRFWKKKPLAEGRVAGEFLIAYGILRIINELFREPDASLILGMSRGQFYSLFVIAGGAFIVYLANRRAARLSAVK